MTSAVGLNLIEESSRCRNRTKKYYTLSHWQLGCLRNDLFAFDFLTRRGRCTQAMRAGIEIEAEVTQVKFDLRASFLPVPIFASAASATVRDCYYRIARIRYTVP